MTVRFLLGIAVCALGGCATQPPGDALVSRAPDADTVPGVPPLLLRVGVEHLPPEPGTAGSEDTAQTTQVEALRVGEEPKQGPPTERGPRAAAERDRKHTWTMDAESLAQIDDVFARETLHFVHDLVGDDRRRAQREVGTPILTWQSRELADDGLQLPLDLAQSDEQAEWFNSNGERFLRRPAKLLLRRLPVVHAFDIEVGKFKSANVPLSQPYRETHTSNRHLGRVSMRLHASDLDDPVEVVWIKSGLRLGTSQERLKFGFRADIADDLAFDLHANNRYDNGDVDVRADLVWYVSRWTNVHFVAGNNIDFLTSSELYPSFESPMDNTPGFVVYAVHVF